MTQTVKFSSVNDPRTFDPDAPPENVITCVTPADAQKAASILNAISADNERLRAVNAELVAALKGAQGALRKALPHLPPDGAAVYAGEWLDAIVATLRKFQND